MNRKCCVWAAVVLFVFGVLPVSFYFLRGRKELSVETEPKSTVQGRSPVVVQTDSGGARFMENLTYVSSPGHSVFSVFAFLLLAAMGAMLMYYVYIRFRKWRRAQARAATAPEVVVGAQQMAGIPPVPAVPAVPQDQPPSYTAAEMSYRDRIVAQVRREGYSVPSRNRRRRREPAPEMDCPHHFHHQHGEDEDEGECVDMEAIDSGLNTQRARHRVQSPRVIEYRSTDSPGTSQGSHQMARPRLSDTEVQREF
jgi:hypothetical protein